MMSTKNNPGCKVDGISTTAYATKLDLAAFKQPFIGGIGDSNPISQRK